MDIRNSGLNNKVGSSAYLNATYQSVSGLFDYKGKKVTLEITSFEIEFKTESYKVAKNNIDSQIKKFNLEELFVNGKSIDELSQNEAKELVSEDGFFGIKETSKRIADFVINGAGDSISMLKAGREGAMNGYKEAEKIWGGKLPEISQKTIEKTMELIDKRINELGGNILDQKA
jgi:hypothetical protein